MAVGVDNIDVQACRSRGVLVTNTPGVLTEATADLAFGLLLAAGRRIAEADAFVRRGEWKGWSPELCLGTTLHGLTLGIVGMGRIGQAMARRARGFGMHVLYHQRKALSADMERALGVRHVPLDALFRECDAISLHCPLTDDTRGLVSAERLQSMKKGALLVNTARGACIDEKALAHALEHGPLGAAGLDVFQNEPVVEPALLRCTNVVLTPHIASADRRTREAMARTAVDNLLEVFSGRPALTPV
jgi:glyoxylate reductase